MVSFLVNLDGGATQATSVVEEWVVKEADWSTVAIAAGNSGRLAVAVRLVEDVEEGTEVTEEAVGERHDGSRGGGGSE